MGADISSFRVMNTFYSNISNVAIDLGTSSSGSGINNTYKYIGTVYKSIATTNYTALAENYDNNLGAGIGLGNLAVGLAQATSVTTTPVVIASILANTSGSFKYEISNSSARRFGTFEFVSNGSVTHYTDDYLETALSLIANLAANSNSLICTLDSGTATFKYNLTQFL